MDTLTATALSEVLQEPEKASLAIAAVPLVVYSSNWSKTARLEKNDISKVFQSC
jgi:hypothetical protein